MSLAVLAALFSALLHPLMASFAKKAAHPLTVNFWGIVLAMIGFSYVYFDPTFWERLWQNWEIVMLSALFHFVYVAMALTLIAKHEFQVLYPLTRLAPVLILVGEMIILGTNFLFTQITGVIFITIGALIFGFDKKIDGIRLKIIFQILIIASLVAGFFIVDKKILEFLSPAEQWASVFIQVPLMWVLIYKKKKELLLDLKNFKNTLFFTICMVGTWYFALFALQALDGAVVSSIRNLSILFGIFLGAHLFSEGHKYLRYLAALCICGGVILTLWK